MATVNITFSEDRTNLLREQLNENKEQIDKTVQMLINSLDGIPIGVAISALLFTIISAVKGYFGKPNVPHRLEAMHVIGLDLIQFIHVVLLKKF